MAKRINTAKWMDKQKRWQVNVQKDGVRRSFSSSKPGRTGQREANAKADAWLDEGIVSAKLKVSDCLDAFLKSRTGTVAPETTKTETARINLWIRPYIGQKRMANLTEGDLQAILNAAARKGKSKKYISNIRGILVLWVKFCRKNKYTALFLESLEIPQSAKTREKKILQPDDLKKLFSADTTVLYGETVFDNYVYAYRFAVLTGIRPGELLGLRWKDIVDDTVFLKRSINKDGRETEGKNRNARRSFALTNLAKEVIVKQRKISTGESVFEIESQSTFRHRWQKYCAANQINYVSLYELRHTFISIAKRLTDGELRHLAGHSKSMDTYGIYSHEIQGENQNISEKLNEIWREILDPK